MEKEPEITLQISREFLKGRPLSYSSLKKFWKSPKHYIKYLTEKKPPPSKIQIEGRLVETLALEPEVFEKKFLISPVINRRTNAGKEEYAALLEKAVINRMTIADEDQVRRCKLAVESLRSLDQSAALLAGKIGTQVPLFWTDKKTNLPIRGYVDLDTKAWGEHFIVDLKTGADVDPDEFVKIACKSVNLWNLQVGTYLTGYHKAKYKFPYFIFLGVETDEPYNVSVNFCDDKFVKEAKEEFEGTLQAFNYCLENQLFHMGYEFRLMGNMNYFSMKLPGYYKPKFVVR